MKLDVYIDHWVIADGNYEDFCEGEIRQFALEMYTPAPLPRVHAAARRLSAINRSATEEYKYRVVAEVVFASQGICVFDFGLMAYSQPASDNQAGYQIGDIVEGNIALGVDPFFYFEDFANLPAVPPLIYHWKIDSIEQDTTPLLLSESSGRPVWVRDESNRSYERVAATNENITVPRDIAPSYVLHCTKLDAQPSNAFIRVR